MFSLFKTESKERDLLSLFGGFLAHIVMGTIYITGNITIYMASYLQHQGYNINTKDLSILFPLQILGITFTMITGPYFLEHFSARYTLLAGCSLQILSVFITSYLTDYFSICFIYGILQGLTASIAVTTTQYIIPLTVSWNHFPKHKGRVSGVILAGFGLGSSIFNLVSTSLINPDNKSPSEEINGSKYFDSDISHHFPDTLKTLCLIYTFLVILAVVYIAEPRVTETQMIPDEENISIAQGVNSKVFRLMFLMAFCSVMPGFFLANCFKVFGETKLDDDRFLAIVGSVSSICNGGSRMLWGIGMDRFGFKNTYGTLLILQSVLMFSFYYIATNKFFYLVWVSAILGCEGGHFVLFSALNSRIFGERNGAKIYSVFVYSFAGGAIFSFFLQVYLTKIFGYEGLILFLGAGSLISLFVLFTFQEVVNLPKRYGDIEMK